MHTDSRTNRLLSGYHIVICGGNGGFNYQCLSNTVEWNVDLQIRRMFTDSLVHGIASTNIYVAYE